MQQSAIDLGSRRRDIEYGYGLPDAQGAVDLALQTKGKFRRRYARRGIDPYVDNDWSRFSGILTGESLGLGSELSRELSSISSLALQLPQGFLASTIASTPVPEPASVLLLLVGISLLLWRTPEIRQQSSVISDQPLRPPDGDVDGNNCSSSSSIDRRLTSRTRTIHLEVVISSQGSMVRETVPAI